tara:strand:- start:389 stop:826 length:438 start_codon:yes stop_codon:yes gene_type:complete
MKVLLTLAVITIALFTSCKKEEDLVPTVNDKQVHEVYFSYEENTLSMLENIRISTSRTITVYINDKIVNQSKSNGYYTYTGKATHVKYEIIERTKDNITDEELIMLWNKDINYSFDCVDGDNNDLIYNNEDINQIYYDSSEYTNN